jgi:hypothetical protein
MINKNLKERHKAIELKKRIADLKAKRREGLILERKRPELLEKPSILIYCEGKNTEPSYFNKFRFSSLSIYSFGEGKNTLSLVKRAIQLSAKQKYDQVWCVFDADPKLDNPKQLRNFNSAVELAERNNFEVAYSNQAFEYWLILHFEDHQGGTMHRNDYGDKLNSYLKKFGVYYDYNGDKTINQDFFDILTAIVRTDRNGEKITRSNIASKRAEKIYGKYDHRSPGKEESSTTVYKLVNELDKYS